LRLITIKNLIKYWHKKKAGFEKEYRHAVLVMKAEYAAWKHCALSGQHVVNK
jgi:hypothetical protein